MTDSRRAGRAGLAARVGPAVGWRGRRLLARAGARLVLWGEGPPERFPRDFDEADRELYDLVAPYTLTPPERVHAVRHATRYVVRSGLEGAIVECGVWRGGSMMAVARTLLAEGASDRDLYLFDTYTGMVEPTDADVMYTGASAAALLDGAAPGSRLRADASLEDVRANVGTVGYPEERVHYVEGPVEQTIPAHAPERIALLRLDTDWYESTRHELEHLYPRLVPGGVLIVDDYGHWLGARRAIDEYLHDRGVEILLARIDYTARLGIKP